MKKKEGTKKELGVKRDICLDKIQKRKRNEKLTQNQRDTKLTSKDATLRVE